MGCDETFTLHAVWSFLTGSRQYPSFAFSGVFAVRCKEVNTSQAFIKNFQGVRCLDFLSRRGSLENLTGFEAARV